MSNQSSLEDIRVRMADQGITGFLWKRLEPLILAKLQDAYKRGADSIRQSPDYHYKEDMGR